ncbi:MAG TPA: hypothetical protein VMT63_06980 [Bacteroidales bacterium]|nr:hypothetical protein [Bacteroidales bacterium]
MKKIVLSASLVIAFLLFSGSCLYYTDGGQQKDNRDKKMDLLERLENGSKITSDEIKSVFGNRKEEEFENPGENFFAFQSQFDDPDFPVLPDLPDMNVLFDADIHPDRFVYNFRSDDADTLISDKCWFGFSDRDLSDKLREIRENMKDFRNSGEYQDAIREFKKSMESFRKEMEDFKVRMKDEWRDR